MTMWRLSKVMPRKVYPNKRSGNPLYAIWNSMVQRCKNMKHRWYHRYGGRGIHICDEWVKDFDVFCAWAKESGYVSGLSIERKDNNGGYTPENCMWVERNQQSKNREIVKKLEWGGEFITMFDLAARIELHPTVSCKCFVSRIRRGWSIEDARNIENCSNLKKNQRYFEFQGKKYTIPQLAKMFDISETHLTRRLSRNESLDYALRPVNSKYSSRKKYGKD